MNPPRVDEPDASMDAELSSQRGEREDLIQLVPVSVLDGLAAKHTDTHAHTTHTTRFTVERMALPPSYVAGGYFVPPSPFSLLQTRVPRQDAAKGISWSLYFGQRWSSLPRFPPCLGLVLRVGMDCARTVPTVRLSGYSGNLIGELKAPCFPPGIKTQNGVTAVGISLDGKEARKKQPLSRSCL